MYESVSKKIKNASERLFDHFQKEMQSNGLPSSGSLQRFQMVQVGHVLRTISELEMKTVITCAVKYWDFLRALDKDGEKLEKYPNFYQMLARWRYKKWLEIFDDPRFEEKFSAFRQKEKDIDETKNIISKNMGIEFPTDEEIMEEKMKMIEEGVRRAGEEK